MEDEKTLLYFDDASKVDRILEKISIFGGLGDEQIKKIYSLLDRVIYDEGEFIFKEGEKPMYIYIVLSGEVKIIAGIDDTPLELITFGTGHCFGETSVIAVMPHSASAVATKRSELLVLSSKALLDIYNVDKDLFAKLILNIAREACRRLHKADETMLHYFGKK